MLNLEISLEKIVTFTESSSDIFQFMDMGYLCIYLNLLECLSCMFCHFTSFTKFIAIYFFGAPVNEIIFLILLLDCLMLIYRNIIGFCIWFLYLRI